MTDTPMKESIFKENPSRPTRASVVLTDLYISFEQVSVPAPEIRSKSRSIFRGSSFLSPSIWIALIILGLSTAFIAFTVDYLSQKLLEARYYMSSTESLIGNFIIWVLFSLFFAVIAASMGKFISSDCEGSGIPEVKTILAGVHLARYLSISTLFAKIAGLTAACAAGLSIGKEGPFVHISAILANKMTKTKYMRELTNVIFD
jgi:H+/Cl- antiporter ClcA